jgi:DNA-directed RNA polymerase beta subunit/DNA-directed RNA polymerase beta' subunit
MRRIVMESLQQTSSKMNKTLQDKTVEFIKSFFPIKGNKHTLKLDKIKIDMDDIKSLHSFKAAKVSGKSLGMRIYGDLTLIDNDSGSVLNKEQNWFLMSVPLMSPHGSFLVDGTDYNIPVQLRLKAGVYHRIKPTGVGEARFNLSQGLNFRINVDLMKKRLYITMGQKTIDLVNFLKGLDVSEAKMKEAWGSDLYKELVVRGTPQDAVIKFWQIISGKKVPYGTAKQNIYAYLKKSTEMDPAVNSLTLGNPYQRVTIDSILKSVAKTVKVLKHKADEDETSSILFKKAMWIDNFVEEVLKKHLMASTQKIKARLDRYNEIDKIMYGTTFKYAIPNFIKNASISQALPAQNPISIVDALEKVTLMGEGGFRDPQAVSIKDRSLNPYQIGFLDPIHTPESEKLGVNLYKAKNAVVNTEKHELLTKIYDIKKKRFVYVTPIQLYNKVVAYPGEGEVSTDGVKWKNKEVHVLYQNKIKTVSNDKVQYIFPDEQSMFDMASNLAPFLDSNQGNRAMMTGKHMSQSIALTNPEIPLVDTKDKDGKFFTEKIGKNFAIKSPVDGVVQKITKDHIIIKDTEGKTHEVEYVDYIPTTSTYYVGYHSIVKAGDKVQKGQVIADSNFTINGRLAMGKNMRVGYVSYKGYNHEDGIIVSETAAKKLSSTHIYPFEAIKKPSIEYNKNKFRNIFPTMFNMEQLNKLDDKGIVKPGTTLKSGDPIFVAIKDRLDIGDLRQLNLSTQLYKNKMPYIGKWENPEPGVVKDVIDTEDGYKIYVKTDQPLKLGDKIVGRHGNKGVVSLILPDSKMPKTEDGQPLEVLLNPHGITSRVNPSQLLETSLAKAAKKEGKPVGIHNFSDVNNIEWVIKKLTSLGLTDKEVVIDPENGKLTNPTTVGYQYMIKLPQRAETKLSTRDLPGYDLDNAPLQGGGARASARAIDVLTLYSLLAHNKRNILKEFSTYKANKNEAVTKALLNGTALPAPQPTDAWKKFEALMKGMGVNVDKQGTVLSVKPITDKDVVGSRLPRLDNPGLFKVTYGKVAPVEGGVFDPVKTGGPDGDRWTYIDLHEKIPNPLYEKQLQRILKITKTEYDGLLNGKLSVQDDQIIPNNKVNRDKKFYRGIAGLEYLASKIDLDGAIKQLEMDLKTAKTDQRQSIVDTLQYLRGLKKNKMKPTDLFISKVPVVPPKYRPAYESMDGSLRVSPLNLLYKQLLQLAEQYEEKKKNGTLTPRTLQTYKKSLYRATSELVGVKSSTQAANTELDGILQTLNASEGNSPKRGFIQRKVIRKSQDYSGGSVITPGPDLGMNEVGLPYKLAISLYRPFLLHTLSSLGYNLKAAQELINKKDPKAVVALEKEMEKRPVLVNRSPSLHKFSIQALRPKLVEGNSIKMNAMVLKGYNADFDGDTVAVHVPITEAGRREALEMLPSQNIFSIGTGDPITKFRLEYVTGLFQITQDPDKVTPVTANMKSYTDYNELLKDFLDGTLNPLESIKYKDKVTTAGRAVVNGILPEKLQKWNTVFDAKVINGIVKELGTNHKDQVENILNTWMKIALIGMYKENPGVGITDLIVNKNDEEKKAKILEHIDKMSDLNKRKQYLAEATKVLMQVVKEYAKDHNKVKNNGFVNMYASGAKGSDTQLMQLLLSPVAVQGPDGKMVPIPIKHSYGQGLTPFEYFTSGYGARFGMVAKKEMVAQPGALNKEILNSISNMVVSRQTDENNPGIRFDTTKHDPTGRILAQDYKEGDKVILKKGDLITPKMAEILSNKKAIIYVKSPMTDTSGAGTAADSIGWDENKQLPKIGENIGVKSGQSVAEPLSQLSMSLFHTGGVAGDKNSDATNLFVVIQQLLRMPTTGQMDEHLSPVYGTVKSVKQTPTGHEITIHNDRGDYKFSVSAPLEPTVKSGDKVHKGDPISTGTFNPKKVADVRGIVDAQIRLKDTLDKLLKLAGNNLRPNILETVIGGLTRQAVVIDSKHPNFAPGSYVDWQQLYKEGVKDSVVKDVDKCKGWRTAENYGTVSVNTLIDENIIDELKDQGFKKIKVFQDVATYEPFWKGSARQTLSNDDWLHKLSFRELKKVIPASAVKGEQSDVAGYSPITAWMYGPHLNYGEMGKYGAEADTQELFNMLTELLQVYTY